MFKDLKHFAFDAFLLEKSPRILETKVLFLTHLVYTCLCSHGQ